MGGNRLERCGKVGMKFGEVLIELGGENSSGESGERWRDLS